MVPLETSELIIQQLSRMSYIICLTCAGTGLRKEINALMYGGVDIHLCTTCSGLGRHKRRRTSHSSVLTCESCAGQGVNRDAENLTLCGSCNGTGISMAKL